MSFSLLREEVENGMLGKNAGIPMGFNRLNKYIGIRKRIMTLIFGPTGSGKSAYLHSAYILSPFDWYYENKPKDTKLKIILFSMERSKIYILAKWMSRKIFLEQGILIPIQRLLGWWTNDKLSKDEHDLFLHYEWYINELLEIVDIIEGPQNPTAIYKYVKKHALDNGKVEEIDEYKKVYIPNHSNELVLIGEDHLGLTKMESNMKTKKEAIDKVSEYNQYFRDFFGYSPIPVSQLVRGLNNPMYQKMDSFEPTIDDVKESGRPGEDSDVVISTFEPLRFRTTDPFYDAERFVDKKDGSKYYRGVQILKNSFGQDGIRAGMAFMGSTGIFKELPRSNEMENFDYNQIFDNSYFLKEN